MRAGSLASSIVPRFVDGSVMRPDRDVIGRDTLVAGAVRARDRAPTALAPRAVGP